MDRFQTEPLDLTRTQLEKRVNSTRDLCKDCNSEYCIVKKFQEYQSERIRVNPYHRYECVQCGKSYSALSTLRNHQRTHVTNKSFCCEFCSKRFNVECELKEHLNQHNTNEEKPTEKPFECGFCAKSFSRQSSLSAHNRIHKNTKPRFQCTVCGKHFRWKSNLTAHLALHQNQKYACELCEKLFQTADHLQAHRQKHSNPENRCRYCEKVFSTRYKVNYHIRLKHQNIAPWQCQFCSESFGTATKYRSHIYTFHDAPKPFSCEKCNRSFQTAHNLEVHETTHRKCMFFECDSCGHQFVHKRNLYTHIMRHCQNKELHANNSLIKNQPIQNSVERNRYYCKECNQCYADQNAAFNCTHNGQYLQNNINNRLNGENTETVDEQGAAGDDAADAMKVKISLVTENQSNQIIPLYELNIPSADTTSTTIDINNSKPMATNAVNRNIEPIILVQAFTTSLNSTAATTNNSIKRNVSVEVSNQVDTFEAFCDSLAPEIIIINDSSSDEETFPLNANRKTIKQLHLSCSS